MCFGRRLWVAPHHAHVHTEDAVIVRLDPGLAFGTGTHATTAMCLAWLDENARRGPAGHRLRLRLRRARGRGREARRARAHAPSTSIRRRSPRPATMPRPTASRTQVHVVEARRAPARGADILLANILCGPLCELAPRFAALTRPGGKIVLAGLLSAQADEVTRAHAPWFDIAPFASRDGWTALTGSRRA